MDDNSEDFDENAADLYHTVGQVLDEIADLDGVDYDPRSVEVDYRHNQQNGVEVDLSIFVRRDQRDD